MLCMNIYNIAYVSQKETTFPSVKMNFEITSLLAEFLFNKQNTTNKIIKISL